MTAQSHFETVKDRRENDQPGRVRAILAKRRAQNEARKQRDIEAKIGAARQLQILISNLKREVVHLDDSIRSELALADVRDPSHFAYPILAMTMEARRENLTSTIAALSDRLASIDQPRADPTPV
jgi:hypothetical protein